MIAAGSLTLGLEWSQVIGLVVFVLLVVPAIMGAANLWSRVGHNQERIRHHGKVIETLLEKVTRQEERDSEIIRRLESIEHVCRTCVRMRLERNQPRDE